MSLWFIGMLSFSLIFELFRWFVLIVFKFARLVFKTNSVNYFSLNVCKMNIICFFFSVLLLNYTWLVKSREKKIIHHSSSNPFFPLPHLKSTSLATTISNPVPSPQPHHHCRLMLTSTTYTYILHYLNKHKWYLIQNYHKSLHKWEIACHFIFHFFVLWCSMRL